jgi:proline iminopeptidase
VIASNGGSEHHPGWYHNIRANPDARLEVGSEVFDVRGRVASTEERARLWPEIVRRYPSYGKYERKTTRQIPLVILERSASA